MVKRKKREPAAGKPKYQLTSQEQIAREKFFARRAAGTPAPRMKASKGEKTTTIGPDHPDMAVGYALLMEALGTGDYDFGLDFLEQLANAGSHGGQVDERKLNFMLAVVKGVKPKDQLEAMLAAQMAAIHMATLTFARRLAHVETIQQQDSAERALNKLARTYATQMEAQALPDRWRAEGHGAARVGK